MPRSARLGLLAAAALTAATAGATGPLVPAGASTVPSVLVHGHLLVVPSQVPGGQPAYAVALADGDIVPVRGRFGSDVRTGAVFDGRLALPASVLSSLSARGESGSAAALRTVDQRSLSLSVVGTPTVTATVSAATSTTHDQFVAAIDNKGALGQTDTQLLGHVNTVGSYWGEESNGAIAGITVPATVTHYATALSTTDCGLGNDFFSVVQEAANTFPGFDDFSGPDQLVLFVPPSCASGSVVGEGTVGSSFASGGALVVKAGNAIEGTYAHETGHNYGFQHANARYAGTSMEYYGVYDVMGFALSGVNQLTALSTPFRVFQGITDPGEIQHVDLGAGLDPVHASATIKPRSDDTGLRSVRVKDPDTGENLYLDYRSGSGQDAGAFYAGSGGALGSDHGTVRYAPGVLITAARGGSGTDVLVLDGNGDTSLGSGDTWRNASRTLVVRVTSLGAAGAHVTVDYSLRTLASAKPTISGKPRVGHTLTAKHGAWTRGTTFGYAWYAAGKRIKHQTSSKLTLAKAQKGKRITVKVTGKKPGYTTVSKTSARTPKVT